MRLELLVSDLEELAELGIGPNAAFSRGLEALGSRPTYKQLRCTPGTEEGVQELVHFYAEEMADLRLIRFSYATKAPEYDRSRRRYDAVAERIVELQRGAAPRLRARLRELRSEEARLEHELRERGIDPDAIGPRVPEEQAIDPTPQPGELGEPRRTLRPLPARRSPFERLFRRH